MGLAAHDDAPGADGDAGRLWGRLWLAGVVAVCLVPVWCSIGFPSQDGPAHVDNAHILREWFFGESAQLRRHYALTMQPLPNLLGHLLLAGLMMVLRPMVAEKVLLSACIVLLPLAGRYAARSVRPGGGFAGLLVAPLLYNRLFQMGFYNFTCGLVLYLVLVGHWLRHRERLGLGRAAVLGVMGMLLYFSHLSAILMGLATLAVLGGSLAVADGYSAGGGRPVVVRTWARRMAVTTAALSPAIALSLWYAAHAPSSGGTARFTVGEMIQGLVALEVLVGHRQCETWPAAATAILVLAVTIHVLARKIRRREWDRWDGLLLLAIGLVVVFLRTRSLAATKLFMPERLSLFIVLTLALWLAGAPCGRVVRIGVVLVAGTLAMVSAAMQVGAYRQLDGQMREYLSAAPHIAPGRTILPLCFSPYGVGEDGSTRQAAVAPFRHAGGYIAAMRNAVDPSNYEADAPLFPVRFRAGMRPRDSLGEVESPTGELRIDIAAYEKKTGQRVDYVLVWGLGEEQQRGAAWRSIEAQIAGRYRLIYRSGPRGLMRVYESR